MYVHFKRGVKILYVPGSLVLSPSGKKSPKVFSFVVNKYTSSIQDIICGRINIFVF